MRQISLRCLWRSGVVLPLLVSIRKVEFCQKDEYKIATVYPACGELSSMRSLH